MAPSPTFRNTDSSSSRSSRSERDRIRSRDGDRHRDRRDRRDRRKSDAFKGSLSEGQKVGPDGSEDEAPIGEVEIPMDSDDEEAQIRKRREARQKMLEKLKVAEESSPVSSPSRLNSGSPLVKFKSRIYSRDSDQNTPKSQTGDSDEEEDEDGIDDILAAALRDDLEGLNNVDLEAALKEKLLENRNTTSIDAKPITEGNKDINIHPIGKLEKNSSGHLTLEVTLGKNPRVRLQDILNLNIFRLLGNGRRHVCGQL